MTTKTLIPKLVGVAGLFLLPVFPAHADPWLVSGVYPAGSVIPEQCVLKETGQPDKVTPIYTDAQGGKRCTWDLAGYSATQHSFTMYGRNSSGDSATGTSANCDLRVPTAPPSATVMQTRP